MSPIKNNFKNALSIDVEDWYQGVLQISYVHWHNYEDRLEKNLIFILDKLKRYNIKATFFVLGYIADKFPKFVKMIIDNSHEVASHGYWHRPIFEQTPSEFREDVERSKKVIEDIAQVKIKGYRAPFFSITKETLWALDILTELGFQYDSSIFPTKNFLYGIPDSPQTVYKLNHSDLIEFPLSVIKRFGLTFPICGGFYMRATPYRLTKWGILSFNHYKGPAIVYLHPWELDEDKPRLRLPLKWKIIYEYNVISMRNKVEQLFNDFQFATISEVVFGR